MKNSRGHTIGAWSGRQMTGWKQQYICTLFRLL